MSARAAERGSALVVSTIMIVVALGIVGALLAVIQAQTQLAGGARDGVQALYIAEAGVNDGMAEIVSGVDVDGDGLGSLARSFAGGQYVVVATPSGTAYIMHSTGTVRQVQRTVEAVFAPGSGLFPNAVNGGANVLVRDSAFVDSWDSGLGSFASQAASTYNGRPHAGAAASVLSGNAFGFSPASPSAPPAVFGSATLGGSSVSGSPPGTVSGTVVTGNTGYTAPPMIPAPSLASSGALALTGTQTQTIGPGDVAYDSIRLSSSAQLTIRGPARVVVGGSGVWLANTSNLTVDTSGGPVQLFVQGSTGQNDPTYSPDWALAFKADSGTQVVNTTGIASTFTVFVTDGSGVGLYSSAAPFSGGIYAPSGAVFFATGGSTAPIDVYGAIVASVVRIRGKTALHYDAALTRVPTGTTGGYVLKMWHELAPGS
jgi:hypothetical protein